MPGPLVIAQDDKGNTWRVTEEAAERRGLKVIGRPREVLRPAETPEPERVETEAPKAKRKAGNKRRAKAADK